MALSRIIFTSLAALAAGNGAHDCPVAVTPAVVHNCQQKHPSCAGHTCGTGKHLKANPDTIEKHDAAVADATCCDDDVKGKCAGNTVASEDVTCPSGHHLKAGASGRDSGAGTTAEKQTACCKEDMCSGNDVADKNEKCSATQKLVANSHTVKRTETCCEDRTGMCSGNAGGTGDVTCDANTKLKPGSENIPVGAGQADCCVATCSGHTCGDDFLQDTSKATEIGNTDGVCCKAILCCGNDDSNKDTKCDNKHRNAAVNKARGAAAGADASCCGAALVAGKCSGNHDGAGDVDCGATKKFKADVIEGTTAGTTKEACCEDSCKAFDCPDGFHLKANAQALKLGDKDVCCDADITGKCRGNTGGTGDVSCSTGQKEINNNADKDATGSNCCEDIVGKCSGNKDAKTDVACGAGEVNGGSGVAKTGDGTNCCTAITKQCTGNKVASENVNCATQCHSGPVFKDMTACEADADRATAKYVGDTDKCSTCCKAHAKDEAKEANDAKRGALLSGAALAGVLFSSF